MLVVRLVVVFTAIAVAVCIGLWMLFDDRRYLTLAGRIGKVALLALVVFLLLLAAERLVVI